MNEVTEKYDLPQDKLLEAVNASIRIYRHDVQIWKDKIETFQAAQSRRWGGFGAVFNTKKYERSLKQLRIKLREAEKLLHDAKTLHDFVLNPPVTKAKIEVNAIQLSVIKNALQAQGTSLQQFASFPSSPTA